MPVLNAINDSCFSIDGLPYPRGGFVLEYDVSNEKVAFNSVHKYRSWYVHSTHYSNYINGATALPFGSYAELLQWLADNIFLGGIGSGGAGSGLLLFSKSFDIKDAPVDSNDIQAGVTITDPFFSSGTITLLIIDGINYVQGDFTVNAGVITLGVGTFNDGSKLLVHKNP